MQPNHIVALSISVAGLATGLGVLPLLWLRHVSQRIVDGLLGFAAGVMLSAASFSLMVPAFESGRTLVPMLGLVAGTAVLALGDALVPHTHASAAENGRWIDPRTVPRGSGGSALGRHVWLALAALALDNVPEGLSIGVSFASGSVRRAVALTAAVALQNIPEGLAAALPLIRSGLKRPLVLGYVGLAGLCEPAAGVLGLALVSRLSGILPFALAFAAGAMLYAAADEMLPEAFSHGFLREAVAGIVGGYVLVALLERLL